VKKKLTISIDEHLYKLLHEKVGRGHIARFIEDRVRPYIDEDYLIQSYKAIAADPDIQKLAKEWEEGTINDTIDEPW
jgi:hypothetical protein